MAAEFITSLCLARHKCAPQQRFFLYLSSFLQSEARFSEYRVSRAFRLKRVLDTAYSVRYKAQRCSRLITLNYRGGAHEQGRVDRQDRKRCKDFEGPG